MNQVLTVFEQIEPLISKLNDSERLELIRSIIMTQPKPANGIQATNGFDDSFMAEMLVEQDSWYARPDYERKQFYGEHVAIYYGKVIDHDADRISLLQRVREKYGNSPIPIIPSEQDSISEYVIHQPQLVS